MSASGRRAATEGAQRVGAASTRVVRVWRGLPGERRLAVAAAIALFLTLFLPWYQETVIASGVNGLRSVSESLTGWAAFSFVEAAVLLAAASVLTLLFMRAEGRAFHVPGGDGGVITAAGFWTCVLIVWRMFDKEGTTGHGQYATTSGIEWGIFIALGVAGVLTYAGSRIRHAHEPEPPLPGDPGPQPDGAGRGLVGMVRGRSPAETPARPRDGRPSGSPDVGAGDTWAHRADQAPTRMSRPRADEAPTRMSRPRADEAPTQMSRPRADEAPTQMSRPRADEAPTQMSRPRADEAPTQMSRPRADEAPTHADSPEAQESAGRPVRAPAPPPADRPRRVRPRSVAAGLDSVTDPAEPATVPLPPSEAPTARRRREHRGAAGAEDPEAPQDQLTTRLDEPD